MPFPIAGIVLKLGSVLPYFLRNNINTRGRGVGTMTLFSFFVTPRILLVVMVLFIGLTMISLALIGELPTRHVSKRRISGFSFSGVLLLFFSKFIPLETL